MRMEDIVAQNPWWKNTGWGKEDKHLKQLEKYAYVYERAGYVPERKGAIVVYGPRQVGKTTWLKQGIRKLLENGKPESVFYLNAEMIKDRFELYETIKLINGLYNPAHIFMDEISAVADWERAIKALSDEGVFDGRYTVLTGSSSINIMKKAERLPGRMAEGQYKFRYYPLSFGEVAGLYGIKAKNPRDAVANLDKLNPLLHRYFLHGGFVRAMNTLHSKGALGEELFSVYSAWIDGELAKEKRSPETATLVMDGVADALTNEVSWSSLAKGVNHVTVSEYVELLRNMFVLDYLEKHKRAGAGAPRNKKIYFTDPFIYWLALFKSRKINSIGLADLDSTTMGKLAEMSAYAAIAHHMDRKTQENDFDIRRYAHFEKTRSGEIDFIVNYGKKAIKLESKFGNIKKEEGGIVYLTKDELGENKLPLSVFLMFPEESLRLVR
ncbi:ATP-binding protein [Candidatus Micrarchaeota archaeon]|nr:ATP-binding protein [Candidatus Micrarchaeota archaeon]